MADALVLLTVIEGGPYLQRFHDAGKEGTNGPIKVDVNKLFRLDKLLSSSEKALEACNKRHCPNRFKDAELIFLLILNVLLKILPNHRVILQMVLSLAFCLELLLYPSKQISLCQQPIDVDLVR